MALWQSILYAGILSYIPYLHSIAKICAIFIPSPKIVIFQQLNQSPWSTMVRPVMNVYSQSVRHATRIPLRRRRRSHITNHSNLLDLTEGQYRDCMKALQRIRTSTTAIAYRSQFRTRTERLVISRPNLVLDLSRQADYSCRDVRHQARMPST